MLRTWSSPAGILTRDSALGLYKRTSFVEKLVPRDSASELEVAATFISLEDHIAYPPPRKTTYPAVDRAEIYTIGVLI